MTNPDSLMKTCTSLSERSIRIMQIGRTEEGGGRDWLPKQMPMIGIMKTFPLSWLLLSTIRKVLAVVLTFLFNKRKNKLATLSE